MRDLKGSLHSLIEVLPPHLSGGNEKNHKNLEEDSAPDEVQTKHLQIGETFKYKFCNINFVELNLKISNLHCDCKRWLTDNINITFEGVFV